MARTIAEKTASQASRMARPALELDAKQRAAELTADRSRARHERRCDENCDKKAALGRASK